jgi:RNA polymerase sigma-70 factor (ECF subfamily)
LIGKPLAFKSIGGGRMDDMETLSTQVRNGRDASALMGAQSVIELEDVVSQNLPLFRKRAYRYVGDASDAEDAVQDALLSAYKHLDQFRATAKMATWLTTIVTNSALAQLRRRPRQPQVSLDEPSPGGQGVCLSDKLAHVRPDPEHEYLQAELNGQLGQSVMELSPSLRKTVQLFYLDGMSMKEVAQSLGVPQGTVKARMSRARSKLRLLMRKV